jgi:pimeloyl-ACP methyl ester carboxylesterase
MDPWLREDYKFNAWVRLQLPSTAEYDYQADSLARTMQRTNANNFILIGHSNGGIVSRRVAQRYPGLARGVITINSPHLGAPAVKYPLGTLSTGFQAITAPFVKMCEPVRKRGCGEIEMLRQAGPFPGLMIDPFGPVYRQMVPGNPFHTSLNSTPERFIRVGLVGKSWDKWRWSGMYADQKYGCLPEQKLEAHGCSGGIDHAWRTDRTFKHYKKSFVLHGLIAIGQALVGDFGKAGESAVKAVTKGGFVALMLVGDSMYDGYVSPGDDSDGIVPVKSQRYPSAERLYEIKDSDTHLGATKALRTRAKLKLALKDVFALDPYTTN